MKTEDTIGTFKIRAVSREHDELQSGLRPLKSDKWKTEDVTEKRTSSVYA